jgi:hypothetical protein
MSTDDLVRRGNAAEQLLDSDVFKQVSKELMDYYLSSILQSAPDDEKGRNAAYFCARALQDLHAVLGQWTAVKDQVIANTEE